LPLSNPEGLVSLLHVQDAARALLAAFAPATVGQNLEIGDGGGMRITALACAIQQAVDSKAWRLAVPRWLAASLAWANLAFSFITRTHPMLTPAKVRELYHSDWSVNDARLAALTGWQPQVSLSDGLRETAAWYRHQGWL
jgi:UDP-glucose 4-epimerase